MSTISLLLSLSFLSCELPLSGPAAESSLLLSVDFALFLDENKFEMKLDTLARLDV